ncbi:hypothetical protein SPOG_05699, partial [Schizosaccharomyces cryophilus OY26]
INPTIVVIILPDNHHLNVLSNIQGHVTNRVRLGMLKALETNLMLDHSYDDVLSFHIFSMQACVFF